MADSGGSVNRLSLTSFALLWDNTNAGSFHLKPELLRFSWTRFSLLMLRFIFEPEFHFLIRDKDIQGAV